MIFPSSRTSAGFGSMFFASIPRGRSKWRFSYAPEDYRTAAKAVVKLGQTGSELDLAMEAEGEEGYQAWKEYLVELGAALRARAGNA